MFGFRAAKDFPRHWRPRVFFGRFAADFVASRTKSNNTDLRRDQIAASVRRDYGVLGRLALGEVDQKAKDQFDRFVECNGRQGLADKRGRFSFPRGFRVVSDPPERGEEIRSGHSLNRVQIGPPVPARLR